MLQFSLPLGTYRTCRFSVHTQLGSKQQPSSELLFCNQRTTNITYPYKLTTSFTMVLILPHRNPIYLAKHSRSRKGLQLPRRVIYASMSRHHYNFNLLHNLKCSESQTMLCGRALLMELKEVESRRSETKVALVKKLQARVCLPNCGRALCLFVCPSLVCCASP